jgi:hypothetical protein
MSILQALPKVLYLFIAPGVHPIRMILARIGHKIELALDSHRGDNILQDVKFLFIQHFLFYGQISLEKAGNSFDSTICTKTMNI